MSAICEICGGTKIVKDVSGDYICQDCGAAYSVDAMRLLLTGEIIEDNEPAGDMPEMSMEPASPEEELEAEVISIFKLGNYQKVDTLVKDYFDEKQ